MTLDHLLVHMAASNSNKKEQEDKGASTAPFSLTLVETSISIAYFQNNFDIFRHILVY